MSIGAQLKSGMLWVFLQQFGQQIVSFGVTIILARLIEPSDFGLIAMITIFTAVGGALIDGGMGLSIQRSKNVSQMELSSVFWVNIGLAVLLYITLYLCAPNISHFYGQERLIDIIRVYFLVLPIRASSKLQNTLFTKSLKFKKQSLISLPAIGFSACLGLGLAYYGYGVWSLVWITISQALLYSVLLWFHSSWKPDFYFDINTFKKHAIFGYKLKLIDLINAISDQIYSVVIAKMYNATVLGFYNRANSLRMLPVSNFSNALKRVTFPLLSRYQEDKDLMERYYLKLIRLISFIIFPLLVLGIILSDSLIILVLSNKWESAIPFFRLLCVASFFIPLTTFNRNFVKLHGLANILVKAEVGLKIVTLSMLFFVVKFGIQGLLWYQVGISFLAFLVSVVVVRRSVHIQYHDIVRELMPVVLFNTLVFFLVYFLDKYFFYDINHLFRILTVGATFVVPYVLVSFILRDSSLEMILKSTVKNKMNSKIYISLNNYYQWN
ncbi:MAG: lipopolysaccharide biosynthesis protein [Salibacteraceae bacterium]